VVYFRKPGPLGTYPTPSVNSITIHNQRNRSVSNRKPEKLSKKKQFEINCKSKPKDLTNLEDGAIVDFDVQPYAAFFLRKNDKSFFKTRSARKGSFPVIFVNGMQGNPLKFKMQACAIAAATGGPVIGVFNEAGTSFLKPYLPAIGAAVGGPWGALVGTVVSAVDVLTDLVECATDKVQSTDWDQVKTWYKKNTGVPQIQIESEMIKNLSKYNRAAGALLELLLRPGFEDARIVAHSQGNIITCNAINAVAAVRGNQAIKNMKIHAVASPVVFWSEAGSLGQDIVKLHAFSNDLVAWLGMNVTLEAADKMVKPVADKDTELARSYVATKNSFHWFTHNFYAYLEKIWTELESEFPSAELPTKS